MQHIQLKCKNHPETMRWRAKSIAVNKDGSYNGTRNIFYLTREEIECECGPKDLTFASAEEKAKWLDDMTMTLEIPRPTASDRHWTSESSRHIPREALESRFASLSEFVRSICEDDVPGGSGGKVSGQRAIELAAWNLYRLLQEAGEL
jgi:hypothetical protein